MGETIVLPKSGVVLTGTFCGDFEFHTADGTVWVVLHVFRDGCVAKFSATRDPMLKGSRDECIAWLDARVLETRAALAPPGHVLVGPEARERIARACQASVEPEPIHAEKALDVGWYVVADAVLRALGVRGGA